MKPSPPPAHRIVPAALVVVATGLVAILSASCGSKSTGFASPDGGGADDDAALLGGSCGGGKVCVGSEIHACNADGTPGDKIGECNGDSVCINGGCASGCAAVAAVASNVGCEFWAVDLDQENDFTNNAASMPWGLVLSNPGDNAAAVTIEQNDGAPGQPQKLATTKKLTLAPGTLQTVEMPTREVDGSLQEKNEGPGTMLSSRAFRVTSDQPIVVYQFNALKAIYSNDASLLLPTTSLGQVYRTLSWPTGNPVAILGLPISHGYVTVVGTAEGTSVTVTVANAIVAGGGIPATAKGGVVTATLGPFDVLNLETDGAPGDMTGSIVTSSKPVAVFVGTELSGAPDGTKTPPPPPGFTSPACCLDHLEEQLLPVESYGKKFALTRSPDRSGGSGYMDYDMIRFMGVAAPTKVTTNLPPPDDAFTLAPGEIHDAYTQTDFVATGTEPFALGQILVSQQYTSRVVGDPSLTVFPSVDQHRQDYLFNVPTSWAENYVVIAMPEGTKITIDGADLPGTCVPATVGTIDGVAYQARRCPMTEGVHKMAGDKPFGIAAYGYGNAGSYAFIGGANVKKIYTPPPIK
jgi:IgGFc binding protein